MTLNRTCEESADLRKCQDNMPLRIDVTDLASRRKIGMDLTHRLAQRSTLSHCDCVSIIHTERWADVRSKVGMSFLVSGVLGNEVEVFAADDEGSVHFRRDHFAGQDSTSN